MIAAHPKKAASKPFDRAAWIEKNGAAPCRTWRVQGMKCEADTKPLGNFDELAVGHWLHVEMMDNRAAFIRIGNRCFWVSLKRSGKVEITGEETRE